MKTLIEGGWVVVYNGTRHELHERHSVVVKDGHILHAGGPYSGAVDEERAAEGKKPLEYDPEPDDEKGYQVEF